MHTQRHFDIRERLAEENRRRAHLADGVDSAGDEDDPSAPPLQALTEDDFPQLEQPSPASLTDLVADPNLTPRVASPPLPHSSSTASSLTTPPLSDIHNTTTVSNASNASAELTPEEARKDAKKKKNRKHHTENRRRRRDHQAVQDALKRGEIVTEEFRPPKRVCFTRVKEALSVPVSFNEKEAPVAATGWVGKVVDPDGKLYDLDELLGPKFNMTYVPASR